jgi:hypothetical protein
VANVDTLNREAEEGQGMGRDTWDIKPVEK